MANTIRVKRTTTSNRPASLANAEIAFIEGSQILVYGTGTGGAGGSATSVIDIGGVGAFLSLSSGQTQTAAGTYTFSGTVNATTQSSSDNSTRLATTAFVKSQGYLTTETYLGTVTSVGLSLPGIFTVSGSPVTSSGTLSATLASQSANAVFAGPTTGGSTAPSFRSLVAADIPSHTASLVSDLASTVQGYRLDQFAVPTSSVSINSQKITNLADPSADTDGVNKRYADALKNGLDVKQSVRVATTANITLSGTQTIDGVAVVAGDRVLVKNQTSGSQNGIYVVAAGSWSRSTDADLDSEVSPGMFAFIEEGTTNADTGWVMTTNSPTTLGTTALTFAQFSGAGSLSVDATLSKVGNTIGLVSGTATAGTYTSVTVDTYGRVTAGSTPAMQAQITAVGILKGAGSGSVSAAVAGTDYLNSDSTLDCGSF